MGKKKQNMAEKAKSTEKRIKEREFFVNKIKSLEKTLAPEQFNKLNAIELGQKCER